MTMSKNPVLLQKVLENWLRLPERQELFAGVQLHHDIGWWVMYLDKGKTVLKM